MMGLGQNQRMSKKVIFVRRRGRSWTKEEEEMRSVDVEDRLEMSGRAVDDVRCREPPDAVACHRTGQATELL
jgi:hypothetical protein